MDEVLSVGDGAFRKKSEAKMRQIIALGAGTILVSHSLEQVRELCAKVLWLEQGEQIACRDTAILCGLYQQYLDKDITLDNLFRDDVAVLLLDCHVIFEGSTPGRGAAFHSMGLRSDARTAAR